jgi:effector-binding domain-containing protein
MLVYHNVIDQEDDGDLEIAVPVEDAFSDDSEVYGRQLEGATMATTLHHGRYEEITPVNHMVTSWVSQNGYEIAGPTREVCLNDSQMVTPELLTRLEFPIRSEA